MKNYELLFILPSNLTSSETASSFSEVKNNIAKLGGTLLETLLDQPFLAKSEISKEEEMEELKGLPIAKRRLVYPVKKNRFGFYCLLNFTSEPANIKEIDSYLKMNARVLRHIIVQAEPVTKNEMEQLEKLSARKKAEQEKEKEEIKKKEELETKEKETEKKSRESAKLEKKKETEEAVPKEKKEIEKTVEKTETKKTEKEKEEETSAAGKKKKKKIKLEELEDKLDEILEDTKI